MSYFGVYKKSLIVCLVLFYAWTILSFILTVWVERISNFCVGCTCALLLVLTGFYVYFKRDRNLFEELKGKNIFQEHVHTRMKHTIIASCLFFFYLKNVMLAIVLIFGLGLWFITIHFFGIVINPLFFIFFTFIFSSGTFLITARHYLIVREHCKFKKEGDE